MKKICISFWYHLSVLATSKTSPFLQSFIVKSLLHFDSHLGSRGLFKWLRFWWPWSLLGFLFWLFGLWAAAFCSSVVSFAFLLVSLGVPWSPAVDHFAQSWLLDTVCFVVRRLLGSMEPGCKVGQDL